MKITMVSEKVGIDGCCGYRGIPMGHSQVLYCHDYNIKTSFD